MDGSKEYKWISVKDSLPEYECSCDQGPYLVTDGIGVTIATVEEDNGTYGFEAKFFLNQHIDYEITHWMKFPKAPELSK
jgi:hypothetical protein